MEKTAHKSSVIDPKASGPSFIGLMINDYLLKPDIITSFTYINLLMIYFFIVSLTARMNFSYWFIGIYMLSLYIIYSWRKTARENERIIVAHRIPFFADALANSLAIGGTLEQAFNQSIYYLRGEIKIHFEKLISKTFYGQDLGELLRELDARFPRTGLNYLISLLEEYRDLGIGISPLLKQMAIALTIKEDAEEKIRTILAGGSSYAKLSIGIFGICFGVFAFMLKDQVTILLSPNLKPVLFILIAWSSIGILIVTRITSLDFSNHYALRPYIKSFMEGKQWTKMNLVSYSGLHENLSKWLKIAQYIPLLIGFIGAYVFSWYSKSWYMIEVGYLITVMMTRFGIEFYLKGLVEDQLIKTVEQFPDFLQVYIIGLNSGLNSFLAFEFAENAISSTAPELLRRELHNTKVSLECGKNHTDAWQILSEKLPFEAIIDFAEIMIISPTHGESIVKSIVQMMNSYQAKKLNMVEKKATALGQYVIPVIVMAFFPLFLFTVFGPLWMRITVMFPS